MALLLWQGWAGYVETAALATTCPADVAWRWPFWLSDLAALQILAPFLSFGVFVICPAYWIPNP